MNRLFLRYSFILLSIVLATASYISLYSQTANTSVPDALKKGNEKPSPTPTPAPAAKGPVKIETAEQVAEAAILISAVSNGYPVGRVLLNQIRKTTFERGKSVLTAPDGRVDQVSYQKYIIRGDSISKERIRVDQELPSARFSLVFSDEKIFGIYNNTVFTPTEEAAKTFENQYIHGLEALLRYKENESKLEIAPREKIMGVDYYVVDVTDKQDRKTRFYISAKSFQVKMLSYEEGKVKYLRKFYDYNYAQGTLVPYHSELWAGDKKVEETDVSTITFGQKVDDEMFKAG